MSTQPSAVWFAASVLQRSPLSLLAAAQSRQSRPLMAS